MVHLVHLNQISKLSAYVGSDITLIQGAGGNISIKEEGVLWVKASGKWLARATKENIFVGVDLTCPEKVIHYGNETLRPSIETSLHALMPHKIVLHVHSVNTIAWAVQKNGQALIQPLLKGLKWVWVPYEKPGPQLSLRIAELTRGYVYDVVVLANHGLIVGAETCDNANALLLEVEKRLAIRIDNEKKADINVLETIAKGSSYRLPENDFCHSIALDGHRLTIAKAGVLYPDHVVFLGRQLTILSDNIENDTLSSPKLLVVPGKGILVHKSISKGAEAMVEALAHVIARIPPSASINYLSNQDINVLLDWDAEKYRQHLNTI